MYREHWDFDEVMEETNDMNYCDCGDYCEWCHPEMCGIEPTKEETAMNLYLILVLDEGFWRDTGEGPFDTRESAIRFATSEVGMPWVVVLIDAADNGQTVSQIAGRNK